jgi:hypothetical protein
MLLMLFLWLPGPGFSMPSQRCGGNVADRLNRLPWRTASGWGCLRFPVRISHLPLTCRGHYGVWLAALEGRILLIPLPKGLRCPCAHIEIYVKFSFVGLWNTVLNLSGKLDCLECASMPGIWEY